MIDTGASCSLIDSKLVQDRGLVLAPAQAERSLRGVGGAPIEVEGIVKTTIHIANEALQGNFLVVNKLFPSVNLLLGRDFIAKHAFTINTRPWSVHLKGKPVRTFVQDIGTA